MNNYYLDSSILVPLLANNHIDNKLVTEKLDKIKDNNILLISLLTIDETWYFIYKISKNTKTFGEFSRKFKKVILNLLKVKNLYLIKGLNETDVLNTAIQSAINYNIRPRDSFHYAKLTNSTILTKDKDFIKTDLKVVMY